MATHNQETDSPMGGDASDMHENRDSDIHQNGITNNNDRTPTVELVENNTILQRIFSKNKEEKQSVEMISLRSLFRYARPVDVFYMLLGSAAATAHGAGWILLELIFGNLVNIFTNRVHSLCSLNISAISQEYCPPGVNLTLTNFFTSATRCNFTGSNLTEVGTSFESDVKQQALYIVAVGFGVIVLGYCQIVFWKIAYFDKHKTGELNTKLTNDISKIRDGIGDKLGSAIQFVSTFIIGCIWGFARGWKLTLVLLSISPLICISIILFVKLSNSLTILELKAYGHAGVVAEEVFSSIRTVLAYNGQSKEEQRYSKYLNDAEKSGIRNGIITGVILGTSWFCIFGAIYLGVVCLSQAIPHIQALFNARCVAYAIWKEIDTSTSDKDHLIGNIHFDNVHFCYPSRPNVQVLNNISFDIKSGETVALVGSSGSGKSTCIQLLQRFYDPDSGLVLVDGKKVDEYNIRWLRQQIGVVSQEPVLFQMTIRENILFGHESTDDEDVYSAAKLANAHEFIMALPDKYDTQVGERGATLSGGQKQRIAIARALIRNPKILLFDEATSALDNESEQIVQDALNHASKGRTTLIIAHRVSTIRHANKIIVIHSGQVIEEGDHDSLMHAQGAYYALVEAQNLRTIEEEDDEISLKLGESKYTTLAVQANEQLLDSQRNRSSTVISLTPSIITALYGKKNQDDKEQNKTTNNKTTEKKSNPMLTMLIMNRPEWLLIALGCVACICNGGILPAMGIVNSKILSNFLLACSGEALTKRIRLKVFQTILRQEIAYFDAPENNTGALCTRLSTKASAVQGATGIRLGILCQSFAGMGTGVILSFIFSWQLTLLLLSFMPFIVIGGFAQSYLMTGFTSKDEMTLEQAGQVAIEALQNIRTVVQLGNEEYVHARYCKLLNVSYRTADYGKAIDAAETILELFMRKPSIDNGSTDGDKITNFGGQLEFKQAYFIYPNRPEAIVLRNFGLKVESGQKVALVGASGSGKSTTIQLIERFYDMGAGSLMVDSKDVRNLNLQWYRSQIGVVSQEPVLFDTSIRENIAYGDTSRDNIPIDEIIRAAQDANIHDFIHHLPNGYETTCGAKGIQLSGGQKQRIAIARVLLRNPKILLLDEASSALDGESEKAVQDALDRAQQNRTSITIAHRLSTIQNADVIHVLHNGRIVESGTHQELLEMGGRYYRLAQGHLRL
ncbi:unnamed protein product [Adineta steineri]|uniref:Uncharacterized protein n=1 Tax=Adineta steineri TaxID=433720 RepID=A0A818S5D0_9BILA|nr:unnamed protein product [Adineta steineri]